MKDKCCPSNKNIDIGITIQILVALANIAIFGALFMVMNYFELMGADPAYFDEGTINNIRYINNVIGLLGLHVDPTVQHKVSTLHYAVAFGIAFAMSGLTIMVANRRSDEFYEVTDAK